MDNKIDITSFKNYLNTLALLSEQEWKELFQILHVKHYKKKEQFQAAGKRCIAVGFILQGCFRSVREHKMILFKTN
ncbi:hypothetical protein CLV51_1021163 [Chitinophaga niastensis]|uniref:Cyclic nucleotide-binding domain-containing protein n=1 Tax=Chitinophaga niastensis TaxID=536980 RepID=A0A2P8HQ20_CHINA|nr:hypothetical protein CLV51_1021163 [Chitinophaga niastensis]